MLFIFAGLACDELIVVDELAEQSGPRRRVWYVHPDSGFNTIQAGLDSCAAGDTVLVAPATYHEHLVWPNVTDICLLSETWPEQTIIDADSTDRVIAIAYPVAATISGFTIRHGFAWEDGAGIYCDTSCQVNLNLLIVDSNTVQNGGAVYGGKNTSLIIEYSRIVYNFSLGLFGERADVILYDCDIQSNHNSGYRGAGGGIWCSEGSLCATNCTVINNTVGGMYTQCAAGIVCNGASAELNNILIAQNDNQTQFGRGGGVTVMNNVNPNPSVVTIDYSRIIGNSAEYGAGIYCSDGQKVIVQSTAIDSNFSYLGGAGIYSDGCELVVTGCHIRNNQGDGICVARVSATINESDISGNSRYGVANQGTNHIVNAENNWWGDASGPAGAGPGSGDSVSVYVDYIPWRTQP